VPWQFAVPEGFGFVQALYMKFFIDSDGKEYIVRDVYLENYKGPNGKIALKDAYTGDLYSDFVYDKVGVKYEEMLPVMKDGKWGFYSLEIFKEVVPFIYDEVDRFSYGLCPVKKNGKWGYIDKTGVTKIPFEFDEANMFNQGEAIVKIGKKKYIIDLQGKVLRQDNYYSDPWDERPEFNSNTLSGTYYLEYNHVIDSPYSTPVKGQKSQELDDPVSIKVTPNSISTQYYHFTVESSGYHNGQRVYNLERNSGNNTYLMFVFFGNGEDRCAFMTRDGMVVYATGPMQFGK
jgi:hypothetical protein